MFHYFCTEFCVKYKINVNAAILLSSLCYWVKYNENHKKNFHDGKYWTFNSVEKFSKYYPYLSNGQIRFALDTLRKKGIVDTANYNPHPYLHSLWYSPNPEAMEIYNQSLLKNKDNGEESQEGDAVNEDKIYAVKEILYPGEEEEALQKREDEHENEEKTKEKEKITNKDQNSSNRICKTFQDNNINKLILKTASATSTKIKEILHEKDTRLVFDRQFYDAAAAFVETNQVDPTLYSSFLFELAKKKAKDIRSYYYSIFFKEDILSLFQKNLEKATLKLKEMSFHCPCCGKTHTQGCCPDCGLSHRSNDYEIEMAIQRRKLSPQDFEKWFKKRQEERKRLWHDLKIKFQNKMEEQKNEIDFN